MRRQRMHIATLLFTSDEHAVLIGHNGKAKKKRCSARQVYQQYK